MRTLLVAAAAAITAMGCERPSSTADFESRLYAISPRGTPIDDARRLLIAAGFSCDSIQILMHRGTDVAHGIPCLNATMRDAGALNFWLVAEEGRLDSVVIGGRK